MTASAIRLETHAARDAMIMALRHDCIEGGGGIISSRG